MKTNFCFERILSFLGRHEVIVLKGKLVTGIIAYTKKF